MHQGCPFLSRNPLVSAKHSPVPGPREPRILWHMVTWHDLTAFQVGWKLSGEPSNVPTWKWYCMKFLVLKKWSHGYSGNRWINPPRCFLRNGTFLLSLRPWFRKMVFSPVFSEKSSQFFGQVYQLFHFMTHLGGFSSGINKLRTCPMIELTIRIYVITCIDIDILVVCVFLSTRWGGSLMHLGSMVQLYQTSGPTINNI